MVETVSEIGRRATACREWRVEVLLEHQTPSLNYALQLAQKATDEWLANPKAVEEIRASVWPEYARSIGEGWRNRPPSDGSWPPGTSAEIAVRRFHGLNDDGTALAGDKPAEPEVVKLSPWLEAAITKAKGGK